MTFQNNIIITNEQSEDHDAVERLAALAFGPGRYTRTAFRLREGIPHQPELSFVCRKNGELIAGVRLTNIWVGNEKALLLGPLVVLSEHKGQGYGGKLMQKAVEAARQNGHKAIILVGDHPYYSRFGFDHVPYRQITLPGPVDPLRLLICKLNMDDEETLQGAARPFSS